MLVLNTEEKEVREGVVTYYGDLTTTANYLCRFQKDEAEDLTQQTVTQALTHTSQYKPGTNIKGWLLTIMHNLFVNLYRKQQRAEIVLFEDWTPIDRPVDILGQKEFFDDVKATMNRMPEEQVRPLWLYAQGYKYEEIASMTGLPLGTVKSRIFIARQELKESFNQVEY